MAKTEPRRPRLSIEVEPELRRRLRVAAAQQDMTVREFVILAVERALAEAAPEEDSGWVGLSKRSFARDWDSDADRVYDRV